MREPSWEAVVVRYLEADQHAPTFAEVARAFCEGLQRQCKEALAEASTVVPTDPAGRRVVDRLESLLADLAIAYRSSSFPDGREVGLYRACYEEMDRLGYPDVAPQVDSQLPDALMPPAYSAALRKLLQAQRRGKQEPP